MRTLGGVGAEMKSTMRTARDTLFVNTGAIQHNFLKTLSGFLKRAIDIEKKTLNPMKQELSLLEDYKLHIHRRNGRVTFGCVQAGDTRETGITKDVDRVHELARCAYLRDCIRASDLHIKRMERVRDSADSAFLESQLIAKLGKYADAGLDICRIIFTQEQNEWLDEAYTPNPFHQDNLKYTTPGGIPMRSKSEVRIGSYLEDMGLPYRYDDLVRITSDGRGPQPYKDNYFADFKVPNLLGGITIHEHFGAFQIDNYADNSLRRLNDYHSFPVVELPGRPLRSDEFTWSFENEVTHQDDLDIILLKMIMPGFFN